MHDTIRFIVPSLLKLSAGKKYKKKAHKKETKEKTLQ